MFVKLFLLGRPGCGKSRTAKHVVELAKLRGLASKRFKDYDILDMLFQKDIQSQRHGRKARFRASESGGFDVLDASVLDTALQILEKDVRQHISNIEKDECIIIELARENYDAAFKQFSPSFLQDAYFLLIDTDLETCRQRIRDRVAHRVSPDDHNVSDFALDTYYRNQHPPEDDAIKQRFRKVENRGPWNDFLKVIDSIIDEILRDAKM